MNNILSRISAPLLIGSILALGALAYPAPAYSAPADAQEGPRFIFRTKAQLIDPPTQVATADPGDGDTTGGGSAGDGEETGTPGDDTGTPEGGEEAPAWTWDGHFDMLTFSFPGGWTFLCQTGDWHTSADREARFQMARTYNGAPAVGTVNTKTKAFTYQSDAIEFTVSAAGVPSVTPGHALNGMLPPCYEPDPATHGALYREKPNPLPSKITNSFAGTPVLSTRRIH